MLTEINFDGIIGPSHNYAGLSRGNIASAKIGVTGISDRAFRASGAESALIGIAPVKEGVAAAVKNVAEGFDVLGDIHASESYRARVADGLAARAVLAETVGDNDAERILRAYRLYLAGSALGFERGWMALHQMLASKPHGGAGTGPLAGAQSDYPFTRDYMYAPS